jgi:hypothetical protein
MPRIAAVGSAEGPSSNGNEPAEGETKKEGGEMRVPFHKVGSTRGGRGGARGGRGGARGGRGGVAGGRGGKRNDPLKGGTFKFTGGK